MFKRCLICTDFSDGLHRLVEFVPSLATSGIKQIIFLHVVPLWEEGEIPRIDEEAISAARKRFEEGLKDLPEDVEVSIEVVSGPPVDAISKVAHSYKADVILTGTSTRNLLKETLFGSTTTALAKASVTPLLILRPELVSTYTREELSLRCQHLWRYLLIPYDGSDSSNYLLQKVKEYAENQPDHSLVHCMLVWVVEEGGRREIPKDYQIQKAQEKLELVKAELTQPGLQVNTQVRLGDPFTEILDIALVHDISAIAVSSNTLGKIKEWSARSFAGELIRRCWFPILFFPLRK
ncbi:MAG: universal stress protein [Symploca sp. SIO3C6]|nr:universal stress protein [Symploca sp. SIO3C6]NET05757.1 universal stress protein [Symploca sp. SIO2B6]